MLKEALTNSPKLGISVTAQSEVTMLAQLAASMSRRIHVKAYVAISSSSSSEHDLSLLVFSCVVYVATTYISMLFRVCIIASYVSSVLYDIRRKSPFNCLTAISLYQIHSISIFSSLLLFCYDL